MQNVILLTPESKEFVETSTIEKMQKRLKIQTMVVSKNGINPQQALNILFPDKNLSFDDREILERVCEDTDGWLLDQSLYEVLCELQDSGYISYDASKYNGAMIAYSFTKDGVKTWCSESYDGFANNNPVLPAISYLAKQTRHLLACFTF